MTRAIATCWHRYQPYGKEFYDPLWYGFLRNLKLWANEFDKLYVLDSTWELTQEDIRQLSMVKDNFEIVKIDASLRYYDAYRKHLPGVKEDLIMFMDNDMVVYREGVVNRAFMFLNSTFYENGEDDGRRDVVSIYDTIGEYKTDKMNGKNKFCPYWFATRTELLKKYLDVEWGLNMPEYETFGKLTEKMLEDGVRPYEWEEDKTDFPTKNLGWYHIRAGSAPAYLLAEKHYGNEETYWNYLKHQPKSEYLRQCKWYAYMGGNPSEIERDSTTV